MVRKGIIFGVLALFLLVGSLGLVYGSMLGFVQIPAEAATMPEFTMWEADGETLYRMDVYVDTSMIPYAVAGMDWSIVIPDGLNFITATWPEDNFFWEGVVLEESSDPAANIFPDRIYGGVDANSVPEDVVTGRSGFVGSYYWTVNENAIIRENEEFELSFDVFEFAIYDPSHELCGVNMCQAYTDLVTYEIFNIVEPGTLVCMEDLDGDLIVGFSDLLLILSNWGSNAAEFDIDSSGTVDFGDLLLVLSNWGPCFEGSSAGMSEKEAQKVNELIGSYLGDEELKKAQKILSLSTR